MELEMAQTNRELMETLFSNIASSGWTHMFEDALADDLIWTATGSSPLAGRYASKQAYLTQVLGPIRERLAPPPRPVVDGILIDGDQVCMRFHGEGGRGKNGADFNMEYCWIMKLRDGKIVEVVAYFDSVKLTALFEDR
jgi:uncharacterized protein